jgi:hypothetical protein
VVEDHLEFAKHALGTAKSDDSTLASSRLESRVSSYEVCGGQSSNGADFIRKSFYFPLLLNIRPLLYRCLVFLTRQHTVTSAGIWGLSSSRPRRLASQVRELSWIRGDAVETSVLLIWRSVTPWLVPDFSRHRVGLIFQCWVSNNCSFDNRPLKMRPFRRLKCLYNKHPATKRGVVEEKKIIIGNFPLYVGIRWFQ